MSKSSLRAEQRCGSSRSATVLPLGTVKGKTEMGAREGAAAGLALPAGQCHCLTGVWFSVFENLPRLAKFRDFTGAIFN